MRANEFITESIDAESFIILVNTAQKYLDKMLSKGINDRSAVATVIDALQLRHGMTQSAAATKKAFINLKGSDVTTEGIFDA